MRTRWIIVLVVVSAGLAAGVFISRAMGRESAEPVQIPEDDRSPWVKVELVGRSSEAMPIRCSGILLRRVESLLAFHKSGMLADVLVRPGDTVKRGQVLARLRLDEINASVARSRAQVEKSRRDVARFEQLQGLKAVSLETLEHARTELELAEAELKIAEFARRHAEIMAPDDGAVLGRLAEPDEWVEQGRAVIGFGSDTAGWIVKAAVAEPEARGLQRGDRADLGGITGRIGHISETADPVTRTVSIEVLCDAVPEGARSQRVLEGVIRPRSVAERSFMPASALIAGEGGSCRVFLWDPDTGMVQGARVEVASFLKGMAYLSSAMPVEKGWVVTKGAEFLRDGMKVRRVVP